jgi:hypothetical protein
MCHFRPGNHGSGVQGSLACASRAAMVSAIDGKGFSIPFFENGEI